MADVYLARHASLGGNRAIKVLHLKAPTVHERFLQEGRLQSTLRHPNIVAVHDVLRLDDGATALVLEYIDGPNLEELLQIRPLTIPQVESVLRGLVLGVQAAHEFGLVHRDLKPANVLLAQTGRGFIPKVGDFGLAKAQVLEGENMLTRAGQVFGTPSYMAPEQFKDPRTVDRRADLFSIGCILYEMLTRSLPFPGSHPFEVYERMRTGEYTAIALLRPGTPAPLVDIVTRCLRPNRDDRFVDCTELLSCLIPEETWGEHAMRAALTGRASNEEQAPISLQVSDEELANIRQSRLTVSIPHNEDSGFGLHDAPTVMASEAATRIVHRGGNETVLQAQPLLPVGSLGPETRSGSRGSRSILIVGGLGLIGVGVATLAGVVSAAGLIGWSTAELASPPPTPPGAADESPAGPGTPIEKEAPPPADEKPAPPAPAVTPTPTRARPLPSPTASQPAPPTETSIGSLTVVFTSSQLRWGRVTVDGIVLDRYAPFQKVPVASGSHRIVVTDADGNVQFDQDVTITSGVDQTVRVKPTEPR